MITLDPSLIISTLMKIICKALFTTLILLNFSLFSQQESGWCGFDHVLEQKEQQNPNYLEEISEKIQQNRLEFSENPSTRAAIYTIPVVFHIIHDGGEGNISMEQIQSGIDVMNEDFAALNGDANQIRNDADAPFAPLHADVQVEFKLAKIDPNGNCTNGVQRKLAPHLTENAGEDCKSSANGGLDAWPNDSYMNIWVVNSIETMGQGTTLGYAYLPYTSWGSGHGILNRHDRIGNIGTAQSFGGRTLTHEMGHICGLFHTFNDGCHSGDCETEGDFICDTPPAEQLFGCLSSNNSCNDIPINDYYGFDAFDMNENHMSYTSCRKMFSEGQKALMQNNFESIPNFISLTSTSNIAATGVNEPDVICASAFSASKKVVCIGEAVDFTDLSYHGAIDWEWTFQGGTPGNSTDENPTITYDAPGLYEVSLQVSDGTNTLNETKTSYISVLESGEQLPYYEDFESVTNLEDDFWVVNNFNNNESFKIGNVGLSGTKSAMLSNYGEAQGGIDELITSPIDLSSITDEVTLSFRYAYRKRSSNNEEWLRIFISNNCGDTWIQRKTLYGDNLGELVETSAWEPSSENDWVTVHMTNITSSYWVDNFRAKFQFENDNGNNFFIDDINIYQGSTSDDVVVGLDEITTEIALLNVYPNPAEDVLNVNFSLPVNEKINISIVNTTGQKLLQKSINGNSGNNIVVVNTDSISAGVYFVKVSNSNGISTLKKIVIR